MTHSPANSGKTLQAVLFDMDGTLLDSEKVWDVALNATARWLGGQLSPHARKHMVGSSLARSVVIMHSDLGVEADAESTSAYLTACTEELFAQNLEWKPGARELLDAVHEAGIPAALVTSTHRRLTEKALNTIGRHYFQATLCGDEVAEPKPHPEPYLRAAQLLSAAPSGCIAIEDSPLGIRAAEAAGCVVIAVPSEVAVEPGPQTTLRTSLAGLTVQDLAELVRRRNAD